MLIIDRFEGNFAICELDTDTFIHLPLARVPQEAKEGDALVYNGTHFSIDQACTAAREQAVNSKLKRLFAKSTPQ